MFKPCYVAFDKAGEANPFRSVAVFYKLLGRRVFIVGQELLPEIENKCP